ncbi:MAG TPA: glycosyltransferase [Patescibacteria group bacterium]|nr:glycosyltransferase [Patescibacteria group bacterium]
MRVLLTAESFLPYLSGVTVSVDALARGLGARGHEVLVLAPAPVRGAKPGGAGSPGPDPRYAWLPSYQLPRLVPPGYRMPWPAPWAAGVREAERFAPDVVHAHSPFVTGLLARRVARRAGAPLVFTHHTRFADYGHYLGPLAGPGAAVTEAYLARFWGACGAVIAPSTDLAAEIAERLPAGRRSRVHVIPTGVDVAGIQAVAPSDPRPAAGWPPDAVVAVSLGRLAPEKSPRIVLDAVALAAARDARLRLLVIGGGPSEPGLRARAARPDLAGRVAFTGMLPRAEALARLRGGGLFVFASRTETQGLVLAEALSAGLPAVAVEGPGVADSVRDGIDGIIVPALPEDGRAERLAAAIAELAGDEGRRSLMAERAAADAGRFSIDGRVGETEALYRSLLA